MPEYLSPIEAIMWRVGQDATLRMTVGALMILDRPPDPVVLAARVARATAQAPGLRRRPDDATGIQPRPAWVDDPDPSPHGHLRTLSVAPPGSTRALLDLVGVLESVPFDPGRSPWDLTTIEGLEGGRAALYARAHHVLTDGLGGIRLLGLLLDEPDWSRGGPVPPAAQPPAVQPPVARPPAARPPEPGGRPSDDRPLGTLTLTLDLPGAVRRVLVGINVARDIDPVDIAVRGVQRALDVANSVSRQLIVTDAPMSARPPGRSMLSRFEVLSVDGARAASASLGGSRNDLLVAAAAAGLGLYHQRLGEPCPELRVATPTRQRRRSESGGNWFAPTRLEVPTAVDRPGPQFGVVAERLAQARQEPALRVASQLAATIRFLPSRLLLPALHAQADSVDFAATTLPGPRASRHICGSLIEASYPFGPRLGCPMNVTAFGTGDRLEVGIALDPTAIAQPDLLVECLTTTFGRYATTARAGDDALGVDGASPTAAAVPTVPADHGPG